MVFCIIHNLIILRLRELVCEWISFQKTMSLNICIQNFMREVKKNEKENPKRSEHFSYANSTIYCNSYECDGKRGNR